MKIIEIQPLPNGAHRNQDGPAVCPSGWAVIPDSMEIPSTYPFVNITVSDATPPVVLMMEAGTMPEPTPPEPDAITQTQLALAEMAETEAAHDLENKLALAELAEAITGGTANG